MLLDSVVWGGGMGVLVLKFSSRYVYEDFQ